MNKSDREKLERAFRKFKKRKKMFLGYPCDAEFDYSPLYKFLEFPINNIGDPYEKSTFRLQTKDFEKDVLASFSRLYNIENYWGYITSGGTEGNQYGMYLARELLGKTPVYFSDHTHYSIRKNAHILNMKTRIIKSDEYGEMDYDDFEKQVRNKKKAIIVANIGTTMMGAIDKVETISEILERHNVEYYIHADAALYGMVLPFISDIKFDFRTKINSIAVSGHKFIGSPIPCGVVMCRKKIVERAQHYIEYINAHDTTLSGSRDAFTALILWYRIKTKKRSGFKKYVGYSNFLAKYLEKQLREIGWANVHRSFITVSFKRPSDRVVIKWELAVDKDTAHVICLPHDTKEHIDAFIKDLM